MRKKKQKNRFIYSIDCFICDNKIVEIVEALTLYSLASFEVAIFSIVSITKNIKIYQKSFGVMFLSNFIQHFIWRMCLVVEHV
ncbi:hypothetical protein BpHYR1_026324 [Brachionus plicatilis]|uniref:Uncharacterized protein n=1 Tax=Brachionus plicatilis TaxID=10195 RepID=A0A3M7QR43_BRAPC|nr:hypothetical protein BpHYR1_026324 [Brachionus plicatilis]